MKSLNLKQNIKHIIILLIISFIIVLASCSTTIISKKGEPVLVEPKSLPGKLSNYVTYTDNWFYKAMDVVKNLRGLDYKKDLYFQTITKSELPEMLIDEYNVMSNDEVKILEAFYRQIGYLNQDETLSSLVTADEEYNSIAGFYNIGTNTFFIVKDFNTTNNPYDPVRYKDIIIIHELTHALQDMNFNLSSLILRRLNTKSTDAILSFKALVEGDATLTHYLFYLNENSETENLSDEEKKNLVRRMSDRFKSFGYGGTIESDIPSYWVKAPIFVYLHGAGFVSQLYLAGGFDAVNNAYTNRLPISSEQIMHPIKYLKNDVPVEILIPDISKALQGDTNDWWKKEQSDTIGEFNFFILIEKFLSSKGVGYPKKAAEGWDGDKVEFYINTNTQEHTLVWVSVWDTPQDATEFYDAYISLLPEKIKDVSLINYSQENAKWTTQNGNIYAISKKEKAIYIAENIPDKSFDQTFSIILKTYLDFETAEHIENEYSKK